MQKRAAALARALRSDKLSDINREELAHWMDALAGSGSKSVAAINALLVAMGGKKEAARPRKNATKYPAIAYHWRVCKELRLSRTYVAKLWRVSERTVTDALRDHAGHVERHFASVLHVASELGRDRDETLLDEERLARPRRKSRKI